MTGADNATQRGVFLHESASYGVVDPRPAARLALVADARLLDGVGFPEQVYGIFESHFKISMGIIAVICTSSEDRISHIQKLPFLSSCARPTCLEIVIIRLPSASKPLKLIAPAPG